MIDQVTGRLTLDASREEFTALLLEWAQVAHDDTKWARFSLLRDSGLLQPSHRQ